MKHIMRLRYAWRHSVRSGRPRRFGYCLKVALRVYP